MISRVLPDSTLRRMSAHDRKLIGQMTAEEAAYAYRMRDERLQHNLYIGWLNQQQWFLENGIYFHDNATKKRTGHAGDPDFQVCYLGKSLWIEFKTKEGRLSGEQVSCHARLLRSGHYVHVPHSAHEAITITREWQARIVSRCKEVGDAMEIAERLNYAK